MRPTRSLLLLFLLAGTASGAPLPELALTPRGATLRIAVTGDTGDGADEVAAAIGHLNASEPLDAIVLVGDNFYPCGVRTEHDARWSLVRPLTRIGIPIFPVLGNHDYCGGSDPEAQVRATGVIPHWHFPARQYTVRSPVVDFVFLETNGLAQGRPNSVASAIRAAFAGSKKPWRIAIGHHPVVSSGYHGYFPRDEVRRVRTLVPALRDAHVDLYMCGHDHHLELIRGRMLLLISGAGSRPIPPVKLRVNTVFPQEIRRERIGFAVVEISAASMRFRMYDAAGKPKTDWISGRAH